MPLTDQTRIANERLTPHVLQLWRALTPLQTIVSFMNTGAHPDDETSAMLAAMTFRDGVDISYACSTRGEGGQNDIGRETSQALGVLRTAEMERACDVLNLRMYWLSETPDDSLFDFGFSKSGVETLDKWGKARTMKRFVDIIRMERPDIICPTFLDIPGQHGHHRAMTEAAHLVMDLAADPNFTGSTFAPWQVKKMYLPAWSGAGQAYDDDLPPPPATFMISADGLEPASGWSFERIGQQSRAFHLTQAMGRWVKAGTERNFPLHLADTRVEGPDIALSSGLPLTLADLEVPNISNTLKKTQASMDAARAAFPIHSDILKHACSALVSLQEAIVQCPEHAKSDILHKLTRKETQLSHLIQISSRVEVMGRTASDILHPGDTTQLSIEVRNGTASNVTVTPELPETWHYDSGEIKIDEKAGVSDPYPVVYLPDTPAAQCLNIEVSFHGITARSSARLEVQPNVVPSKSATVSPAADIININDQRRTIKVKVDGLASISAQSDLIAPDNWTVFASETGFQVTAPQMVKAGLYELSLTLDCAQAQSVTQISYPHIAPRALAQPATAVVRVIDTKLPKAKIGYIGGGNDRVDHWLTQMGMDVTVLSDADLQSDHALKAYDTIVIGIFAMKFRKGLLEQMPRLHAWCHNGGHLLTLYHRPWDNWSPDNVPPKRLVIGQPSLRWRVTDENADVSVLEPDHSVFHAPNVIGTNDWAGWHKERGLYFAMEWDVSYTPLLSMHDPEEQPLLGAMLVANIGKGQHIHTSLILHHQMERLTPGAFNLMANLLS
jgi:LmbE family N-acetylglucosaminyl deacetylase